MFDFVLTIQQPNLPTVKSKISTFHILLLAIKPFD